MVETSYEPMYYTYKHTCRHTYAQTRVHMHLGMRTRMDTHIQDTLCTDMTTYTHHTHTCTHTHTHTHTHTQRSLRNLSNDTQRLPIDQLPHLCTVYPCHVTSLVTTVMGSAPSMTFLWQPNSSVYIYRRNYPTIIYMYVYGNRLISDLQSDFI